MPNVNLIEEEGGGEGGMQPMSAPPARGGGGGGSKVLVIVLVVVILGGGVFALNKFGIVKLWGKKPKPIIVATIPDEQATQQQAMMDTTAAVDTSGVSFVETPPLTEEQPQQESGLVMDKGGKTTAVTSIKGAAPASNLADMKGKYTIQVSAWRDQSTAQKYAKRLEDAGYPVFIEQRSAKDGDWYTVRIGRYPSFKAARKAVENFAYEIKANYWIDRVRSN